jgi:hypothetical protein
MSCAHAVGMAVEFAQAEQPDPVRCGMILAGTE